MESAFARFPDRLRTAIVDRLGWTSLRPVQELAAHAILDGHNAVVLAPTAGGKTEAALFPLLAQLVADPCDTVGVLYIAPIKALLNNQQDRLGDYTEMVGMRRFVWHGDTTDGDKRRFLKEPCELLMTTPESLEVMLLSPRIGHATLFGDIRAIVIDEIHALAGTDRGAHLMAVCERVFRHSRHDVQRIGLSATVGNPEAILDWMTGSSTRQRAVIDPPKTPSPREIRIQMVDGPMAMGRAAVARSTGRKSLLFCQSRALAETVAQGMRSGGVDVFVHHSSVSLEERAAAEARFHSGSNACIVCTSTLELGIDVGDLDTVLQANAPTTVSSFLQRMGRTGRRTGQVANTTFLCEESAGVLQAAAIVELARRGWVESVPPQSRCWPVLVHQLLALTLQFGSTTADESWTLLAGVPDFRGISRPEYDGLITHMLATGFLFAADGRLMMGETAERTFGRKNFMELYAVFSSPQHYRVETEAGQPIGVLEQAFVDTLEPEHSSFLLGGRAWLAMHVNHDNRVVRARAAKGGKKPSWGGFLPQMLSHDICQEMARLLRDAAPLAYLDAGAAQALAATREDIGPLLRSAGPLLRIDPARITWWTFAGGRINQTIRQALLATHDWKVVADNFQIRVEGSSVNVNELSDMIRRMSAPGFWADSSLQRRISAALPNYRLSKFQPALPPEAAAELVALGLLDFQATCVFLEAGFTP
jgi:ATP-dependent Lhr-like helicase